MQGIVISTKFVPEFNFYGLEYLVRNKREKELKNREVYTLVQKLTEKIEPSLKTEYEKRWEYFFLPVKRSGRLISIPFGIIKYERAFYAYFHFLGSLKISKGKEKIEKDYKDLFKEALRFIPLIKSSRGEVVEKTFPYDLRVGKIKGRYVLEKVMPKEEKQKLAELYDKHLAQNLEVNGTSLNEYLNTAAICYRAAYKEKTKDRTPLQMYKKWADGRDAGMLQIKNADSKLAFAKWRKRGTGLGHPFEIVFSWHDHGIHLYPPTYCTHYSVHVTNYAYAYVFVEMAKALIKNTVPFRADNFEDVLEFLAGETYFTVNDYDRLPFFYTNSKEDKRRYFKHIEWEKPKILFA